MSSLLLLFQGMYLKVDRGKLSCYGLGLIKYRDNFKPIFIVSMIDTCINEIGTPSSIDIGIIDSQERNESFQVIISTYMSCLILSFIGYGGILLHRRLK